MGSNPTLSATLSHMPIASVRFGIRSGHLAVANHDLTSCYRRHFAKIRGAVIFRILAQDRVVYEILTAEVRNAAGLRASRGQCRIVHQTFKFVTILTLLGNETP